MAKILLSQEVKRVQNELRRLSSLLRKPNKFKMTLTKEGAGIEQLLEKWIQDNIDLLGSYKEDDVDANLDLNASVIKNLSIAVSNITSVINRVNALEVKTNTLENTKADKTTTDALQSDINDIVEAILSQEVWKGDFALPLPASDNIVPWNADITNALNGLEAGQKITLKLQNMIGDPVSVFLEESVGDNSFTSESFNGDSNVQIKISSAQFELNGLRAQDRGDYKIIEIRSVPAEAKVDLSNLATIDLSNVNVGVANKDKFLAVDDNGKITYAVGGVNGQDGADGKDGTDGVDGKDGEKGDKGDNGADSTVPGPAGKDGTDGVDGQPGKDGEKGDKGNDGAPGQDGQDADPAELDKKADKTDVFLKTDYEEKEITITPAVYGWKTITDLWTNNDKFNKYKENKLRVTASGQAIILRDFIVEQTNFFTNTFKSPQELLANNYLTIPVFVDEINADKLSLANFEGSTNVLPVDKVEIWDIITPAVKATVLVKK